MKASNLSQFQTKENFLQNNQNSSLAEINSNGHKIGIISRSEIPALHQIEIDGKVHNLGILKDLRKHPFLAEFMPQEGRLSISWVNLKPDEVLSSHEHPTASMIIICEGEGEIIGSSNGLLKTGDIAAIPSHNIHGFIGRGEKGFWGLSIQFEGLGLYENKEISRVSFINPESTRLNFIKSEILVKTSEQINSIDTLLEAQRQYEDAYKNSPLMQFLKTTDIQDLAVQKRLLEILNYWGNWFQRIICARVAIEGEPKFQDIAEEHVREEAGHNKNILATRGNKPVEIWDPVLDACAAWFYEKMMCGTDAERTVLIHFVLEGSGQIFHLEASKSFPDIDHFLHHGEEDDGHFDMGCQLLKETHGLNYNTLKLTLQRGWSVMEILCNRIATIASGEILMR